MRTFTALACSLLVSFLIAQPKMPATTRADIALLKALTEKEPDARKLTELAQGVHPVALVHGRCMVGFLAKEDAGFDPTDAASAHVTIGARVGGIVSIRVDAYHLEDALSIPGISYLELAGQARPDMDKVLWTTRADSVHRGINLPMPYTGRDVLIGICDWGFDYTHPDLYDTLLTQSRIRAAWDQYKQSGPSPTGFPYGTEYGSAAELMAAGSDTANIYSYHYHGTHVAGIAGGSGAGTPYRGVAFESQFLLATWLIDAAAVMDCYAWMKQIADADQKRLVINQSWGLHHIGTLDGNSLLSQAIDALSAQGVVFVNSAGNNGDVQFHLKKAFTGDTLRSRIQFYNYTANANMWGQSISLWGEAGQAFSAGFLVTNNSNQVQAESPWYYTATQQPYFDSLIVVGTDTVFFNLTADAAHPLNGRPHFRLRVKNRSAYLKVVLKATATSGTVHAWNVTELVTDVGNWGQAFQASMAGWAAGDTQYGISEPATTESLISVAAFSSEYLLSNGSVQGGTIASFSSFGPTLDERVKPDIAAPGMSVSSAISSFTDASYNPNQTITFQGQPYTFARLSGTSMSSPVVAGIAALLLDADPTLTPAQVKDVIKSTARTDVHTGVIPAGGSLRWGMGKVNAYRAITEALGVVAVPGLGALEIGIWPNPASSELFVAWPFVAARARISIADAAGRLVLEQGAVSASMLLVDVSALARGSYMLTVQADDARTLAPFVKH
ncbi:MAG: S8 family peptidase [Flavobacteriales bacterium]|nr:S8 family peptidase [Flavobacteriales bacterium]